MTKTPTPLFPLEKEKGYVPLFSRHQHVDEDEQADECQDSSDAKSDRDPTFHESNL